MNHESWQSIKWGEIATLEYGKALHNYDSNIGLVPVFGTNGLIGYTESALCPFPSVIIGRKGAYRGVHFSKTSFYVIDTAFYLNPKTDGLDLKFAYYQLLTQDINSMDSGSAIPSTSRSDFYNLPLNLPPLPEQRAIADVLSALDDKIELNRRMNQTLEQLARALFKHMFIDNEEKIDTISLADLFESKISGDWGSESNPNNDLIGVYCIRGTDLSSINVGSTHGIPMRFVKESSLEKRRIIGGDIVIELSGGSPTQSTGRSSLILDKILEHISTPLVCSNFCRVLRLKDKKNSLFVAQLINYFYEKDEFFQYENGTTGIKNFDFVAFASDCEINNSFSKHIDSFNHITISIIEKIYANTAESKTLADLRDTLLPKLMSGQVRVIM